MNKCIIGDNPSSSYKCSTGSASAGGTWAGELTKTFNRYNTVWAGYYSSPTSTYGPYDTDKESSSFTYDTNYKYSTRSESLRYANISSYSTQTVYSYWSWVSGTRKYKSNDSICSGSVSAYRGLKATVAPTVYLKDTLVIKSGSGTTEDPYILG